MSGGGSYGGSPYGVPSYGAPSLAGQLKSAKAGGSEAGMTEEPTTSVGPGTMPGGPAPGGPGGPGGAPTAPGGGPAASLAAMLGIPLQGNFLGVPFNQYLGGPQASPFAHLGDQILNARHIMHGGAGRFGANNASRFGFAGGSFWRPDSMGYGPAPTPPPYMQPQPPLAPPSGWMPPPSLSGPPPGPQPSAPGLPPSSPPAAGGSGQHMTNLQNLMRENPALAYQYTNLDPSVSKWFFANQGNIQRDMFGGDVGKYNAWINAQGGGNNTSGGAAATNRLRQMAGLAPIDAWRFGEKQ